MVSVVASKHFIIDAHFIKAFKEFYHSLFEVGIYSKHVHVSVFIIDHISFQQFYMRVLCANYVTVVWMGLTRV